MSKRGSDLCNRLLRPARLAWATLVVGLVVFAGPAVAQDQDLNPHGALKAPCATCHSADGWSPAVIRESFDHRALGFGLDDAHGAVSCSSCHRSLQFDRVERTCAGCHQDVHRGELGLDCAQCHTTRAFTDRAPQARLHSFTNFPLEGAHQGVDCRACHNPAGNGTLAFRATPTECASCHQGDFDRTTTPPHASAGFPSNCTICHGSVTFRGARFDHQTTKFPLTGAHQATACLPCHADNLYIDKPSACMACHQADHDRAERPPHLAAGFGNDCEACHTTTAWAGAPFDHRTTRFPLVGAHQAATCDQCHGDGTYVGKPTTCVSCHQDDFTRTTTPPHQPAGFSTVCTDCHNEVAWTGAQFDHGTTQFPLTGAHLATSCDQCHGDGAYGTKPTTCVSCHQSDFAGTTTPPHQQSGFTTDCTSCHTTVTWNTAQFDHATTQFPLTGAHLAATCAQCHQDGVYVGKPTTCVSCHQTEYAGTTTPPHQSTGFSTDCAACHTSITWSGAQFDHQQSQFPLTGAHVATTCEQCHADGVYAGKPTTCVSCHQTSYTQTTNPPHQQAGFPTDCAACHTTITWTGGSFDHQATQFPLTGAHLTTTCAQCHQDGVYDGKPTTCVSCHQTDYDQTASPPHPAAGFATTCATCHTTTTWLGASFDHQATAFPLTGAHLATSCQQCHSDGVYAGKPTTCVSCHQPDYSQTTNPPHQAAGFATTCASCHTTTTWLGAQFDHQTTAFPLTGAHVAATCQQCHSDGVYAGKPTTCVSCHQPDYDQTTNPNHQGAGFPTDCAACHTTNTWLGAQFDHDGQYFPIYSGKHQQAWRSCSDCHQNPAAYSQFTCLTCHEHNKTAMDDKHKAEPGYAYNSQTCLTCHPDGRSH